MFNIYKLFHVLAPGMVFSKSLEGLLLGNEWILGQMALILDQR